MVPGDRVYLRNCPVGQPGSVLREERGRIVVNWSDLGLIGRHRAETLILANAPASQGIATHHGEE
jgi:hypothetical protein